MSNKISKSNAQSKSNKKTNKITWKEVYNKCNHNRISQVTNILKTAQIKSNLGNLLKNYGKTVIFLFVIIMFFLIVTFWNNLTILFCAIFLIFSLCLFAIIYGTYNIKLEEDGVKFKVNFQENIIPYNKLIGIYLTKKRKRLFFIPINYYALEITEFVDKEKMNIYSFPTIMLNKKEVIKFFETFEIKEIRNEEEELKKEEEERKKFYKAIGIVIGIIVIITFVVALILYIFSKI